MSDLNKSSLSEIINLIKLKKISSLEIKNHFIKNIAKSKNLNCFITTCFEKSIKSAKDFDAKKDFSGLLSGVPLAVKDLFCTKNTKTTAGSKILENFVPTMNLLSQTIYGPKVVFYLVNLIVMNSPWVLQMKQVFLEML